MTKELIVKKTANPEQKSKSYQTSAKLVILAKASFPFPYFLNWSAKSCEELRQPLQLLAGSLDP